MVVGNLRDTYIRVIKSIPIVQYRFNKGANRRVQRANVKSWEGLEVHCHERLGFKELND